MIDKIIPYLHNLDVNRSPLSVQINITNRCYSKCIMCAKWQDWPKEDFLTTNKLINLFEELNDMGVQTVVLSGGEPFARDDLLDILKAKGELKVGALTSGLWSSKLNISQVLERLDLLHFSLDAVNNKVYNKIRGTEGNACDVVLKRIIKVRDLIKSKKVSLQLKVNVVVQKENREFLPEIERALTQLEVPYRLSPVHTFDELSTRSKKGKIPEQCVVPFFHCVIDADGEVYSCCHLMSDNDYFKNRSLIHTLGNVVTENFRDIWYGSSSHWRRRLFSRRVKECERCDNRYIGHNVTYVEYKQQSEKPVFL